ncbi:hypothetical protein O4H61_05445 [Roseovarius aestuarii]|nr:hypothetical protein [Roseovarius aestuarii]
MQRPTAGSKKFGPYRLWSATRKGTNGLFVVNGTAAHKFPSGAEANINAAAKANQVAIQIKTETKSLAKKIGFIDQENRGLASIAERLEEHDYRSKWDWVTLAAGMTLTAGLVDQLRLWFHFTSATQMTRASARLPRSTRSRPKRRRASPPCR